MSKIEEIHIYVSYTGRENCPFYCMSDLKRVIIDTGIVTLYNQEFKFCTNLQEINFPETLEVIEAEALFYTGIISVHIPDNVVEIQKGAFQRCTAIKEITFGSKFTSLPESCFEDSFNYTVVNLPSQITKIGMNCFRNARIISLTLPASLQTIEANAFYNCKYCNSSLNFPVNLSEIGDFAFFNCKLVEEISFPHNSTIRGDQCFANMSNVKKVTFPSGYQIIYSQEFAYCTNLRQIIFPETLQIIENRAFLNCGLESVHIPINCTTIEYSAFKDCYLLREIVLNDNITVLPNFCFENTVSLKSINLPNNLKTIEFGCFRNSSLETVNIPASVLSIGDYAFYNCSYLKSYNFTDKQYTFGKYSLGGINLIEEFSIPLIWKSNRGFHLYDGMINLKKVSFEEGINTIFEGEYANCINLKEIHLPTTLSSINKDAFENTGFVQFILPDSVTNLGEGVFKNCISLKDFTFNKNRYIPISFFQNSFNFSVFTIPQTVVDIRDNCFENCKLISIQLPESIRSIRAYAFYKCYTQNEIRLPETTIYLMDNCFGSCHLSRIFTLTTQIVVRGVYCFENCKDIEKLIIANDIKKINTGTFSNCQNLKEIEFPNTLQTIGERAFYNTKISSIKLPESVFEIGFGTFANCYYLKHFKFGSNHNETGGYCFENSLIDFDLKIPKKVSVIRNYYFKNCTFRSIEIPESVTLIDTGAFENCTIPNRIIIHSNIYKVGQYAFKNCRNLTTLKINASCNLEYEAFFNNQDLVEIHLPAKVKISYDCFNNCTKLQNITMDEQNEFIFNTFSGGAFNNCINLRCIRFPNCCQLYSESFSRCSNLVSIYLGHFCRVDYEAFKYCNNIKYIITDYHDTLYYFNTINNFAGKYIINNVTGTNYTKLFQALRYSIPKAYVSGLNHKIYDSYSGITLLPVPVIFKQDYCIAIEMTLLYERDFSHYHFELLYLLAQT